MIRELCKEIREYVDEPKILGILLKDTLSWNKLCTSLDLLEDTFTALDYYKQQSFPDNLGAKYFHTYGVFQTIFLQQDALLGITEVMSKKIDYKKDYPGLYMIRELRNDIAGHPTNRGGKDRKSFHGIYQGSLQKSSFSAVSRFYNNMGEKINQEIRPFDLLNIVSIQEKLSEKILLELKRYLDIKKDDFMKKFGGVILRDKLEANWKYHFSKLSELTSGSENLNLEMIKTAHFETLKERVEYFKNQVVARYDSLDYIEPIKFKLEMVDYIIAKIEGHFYDEYNIVESRVLVYALGGLYEDLLSLADEIDSEFNPHIAKKKNYMVSATSKIKDWSELPVAMKVDDLIDLLGISRQSAYLLVKRKGFPAIRVGEKRIVIPRDKFIEWMDKQLDKSID